MKILFLTDNFSPEVNAPASRTYDHCKEWVKAGAEVTVITCVPNFPLGKVYKGYTNKWKQEEVMDGIRVIRVWSYMTKNERVIKRILDYASFAITAFFAGLWIKTDVIIATSPQFLTAMTGRWLSFFKRKPWIFEVRDLWPESIVAVGAMKKGKILRLLEWLEYSFYHNARRIVVVTDTFKEKIIAGGIDGTKISVHKNGANLEMYQPILKDEALLAELDLKGKTIFAYIGTHGMAHGLDFILNSIALLNETEPNFHFLFIGDGSEKLKLMDLKTKLGITNTSFLPSVPKQKVVRYLSITDVVLVNLKKNDTFKTVIPSKIFEAAAMHKPILLGLEGETKVIIERYNAGLCYEPENAYGFVQKAKEILEEPNYSSFKKGCDQLAYAFNREKNSRGYVENH
jgi:hypothetical protein